MRSPRPSLPILLGIAVLLVLALARSEEIRERALDGLGRGMPAREAELARGFVLGEDEGVDPRTEEDFRRAGLSHLLAVSGQNVTLLALLALPLLAALGVPLRERLLWILALIAAYVPLAGSGPSIQRAAVMGGVGLLATLSGRRASRLYAFALALLVTLAVDPGVAGDIGWQLSFAAVAGIFVLAAPLRQVLGRRLGSGGWRSVLAEGAAVTIAATLATAPLIAFHFEELSTVTLVANLLAMPAVAPAMWMGMVSAAAAQVPGLPLEPVNGVNALLLAYIAQVAAWCSRPSWAQLHVHLDGRGLVVAYVTLAATVALAFRVGHAARLAAARTKGMAAVASSGPDGGQLDCHLRSTATGGWRRRVRLTRRRAVVLSLGVLVAATLAVTIAPRGGAGPPGPPSGLRVSLLDVGQGDAILLQPAGTPAVLVDGGPPGDGLAAKLAEAGVKQLGAAVVTHDQSDHIGGIEEMLGRLPIARLVYSRLGRQPLALGRAAGARLVQVATGTSLRSGDLRLQVLWPPRELLGAASVGADPNQLAVVLLASWHGFSLLLSADAEAEAVPLDPGPVDVLKIAHHGSADAGLAALLDRTRPRLALISVGADNPYGHPTAETLTTLARHGVRTLRTDRDGTVRLEVDQGAIAVEASG